MPDFKTPKDRPKTYVYEPMRTHLLFYLVLMT